MYKTFSSENMISLHALISIAGYGLRDIYIRSVRYARNINVRARNEIYNYSNAQSIKLPKVDSFRDMIQNCQDTLSTNRATLTLCRFLVYFVDLVNHIATTFHCIVKVKRSI